MLEFLLERPVTIGLAGSILSIATFYAWVQSGLRPLFHTSIGLAVGTLALVLIGWFIDTDRDILRRFVYETAQELETNQHQKVAAKIHPQATGELQDAKLRLPDIRFSVARIKSIHGIEVTRHRTGVTATITMNVYIEVEYGDRGGKAPRWVQLILEQLDGEWRIVSFEQREPHYQMLNERGRRRLDTRGY
ncbi:MAG: hypothetical protein MUF23_06795 [Pirellula sp.]|jgi:hypothetical protein|nr:hypothetical protein [Pirellula sp.]